MAAFTSFEKPSLERYLVMFKVGDLVSFEPIEGGIENSNYFIDVDGDAGSGQYVLTIVENHSFAEVPFFSRVLRHLNYYGMPVAAPVQTLDGMTSTIFCGKPTMLFPRLPGAHVTNVATSHCEQVGSMVGAMHVAMATEDLERDNPYSDQWMLDTLSGDLLERATVTADDTLMLRQLAQQYEAAQELDLPRGIIHGDLFQDNVLFEDDQLTGVLDFYHACTDFLVQDVAICINDWCRDAEGAIDEDKRQALLTGYCSQRELAEEERQYLPLFQKFGAARFALTRLLSGEPGAHLKDPHEFLGLLRLLSEDI